MAEWKEIGTGNIDTEFIFFTGSSCLNKCGINKSVKIDALLQNLPVPGSAFIILDYKFVFCFLGLLCLIKRLISHTLQYFKVII